MGRNALVLTSPSIYGKVSCMVKDALIRIALEEMYQLGEENENRMERGMPYIDPGPYIEKWVKKISGEETIWWPETH